MEFAHVASRALLLAALLAFAPGLQTASAQAPAAEPQAQKLLEERRNIQVQLRELRARQNASPTPEGAQLIQRREQRLGQIDQQLATLGQAPEPTREPPATPLQKEPPVGESPPRPLPDVVAAENLLRSGPSPPRPDTRGTYAIQGFMRDNWPVVVDFQPEPDTETRLEVSIVTYGPYGIEIPFRVSSQLIDPNGREGRRLLHLPRVPLKRMADDRGVRPVRIVNFALVSYRLIDGQPAKGDRGLVPAPVKVYGFGAGPQAVGSITINLVHLLPAELQRPAPKAPLTIATYEYFAEKPFSLTVAEIWKVCERPSCFGGRVAVNKRNLSTAGWVRGQWGVKPNAKPGHYELDVRAWLNCRGAASVDYQTCGDEAAWATGSSDWLLLK